MVKAEGLLLDGDVEQARAVAVPALKAGATMKSARCVKYVRAFHARILKLDGATPPSRTYSRRWQRTAFGSRRPHPDEWRGHCPLTRPSTHLEIADQSRRSRRGSIPSATGSAPPKTATAIASSHGTWNSA